MRDYLARFDELIQRCRKIPVRTVRNYRFADSEQFQAWLTSALNLIELTFGPKSTLAQRMRQNVDSARDTDSHRLKALGIFSAAKEEFELGFIKGLRREISDEFVVDSCLHAEALILDGHLQSAAVLAASALEDCFKRRAEENGITTEGKMLSDYINALKSAGVLSGATAKIASGFPKFRNAAMHADWDKITEADVLSVCGFLKSYAIQ